MIAAIVLAAGKSERMGRPKALLPFRGRTFLENILDSLRPVRCAQTVVVLGHHREEILRAVAVEHPVFNPEYEQGMTSSFQAGIRALGQDVEGALIFLVDHPLANPATIQSLVDHFKAGHIILPVFEGRRGHPVLFSRAVLDEILKLPFSEGANTVVWQNAARIIEVSVADPGIRIDVDTPEDFDQLEQA